MDRSGHGPLVEEIKSMLRDFEEIKHVRRAGNGVAHQLAREGCMNKVCKIWVGIPPVWLSDLLASDVGD